MPETWDFTHFLDLKWLLEPMPTSRPPEEVLRDGAVHPTSKLCEVKVVLKELHSPCRVFETACKRSSYALKFLFYPVLWRESCYS